MLARVPHPTAESPFHAISTCRRLPGCAAEDRQRPGSLVAPTRVGATGGSPSGLRVPSGLVLRLSDSPEGGRTPIRPAHGPAATARRPSSPCAAAAHNMAASGKPAGRVVSVMLLCAAHVKVNGWEAMAWHTFLQALRRVPIQACHCPALIPPSADCCAPIGHHTQQQANRWAGCCIIYCKLP